MSRRSSAKTRTQHLPHADQHPSHADWKSNPVVVAAGSAAATVLLCIAVVTQVVIPTQTARLEIEILKLKDSLQNLKGELVTRTAERDQGNLEKMRIEKELTESQSSEKVLAQSLLEVRQGSLLSVGNPYPNGLGVVRIGMAVDEVYKYFQANQVEVLPENHGTISVKLTNSPFQYVNYYFDVRDKTKRITNISFNIGYPDLYAKDFLQHKLIEALGKPYSHPESRYFEWRTDKRTNVYMLSEDSYQVMSSEYRPALWPQ